MLGSHAHEIEDRGVQLAFFCQTIVQLFQFIALGQPAKPQKIASFLEIRIVRQFVDVDTTIGQNSLVSIDVADAGSGCDYSLQPSFGGMGGGHAGHSTSRAPELELLPHGWEEDDACCRN